MLFLILSAIWFSLPIGTYLLTTLSSSTNIVCAIIWILLPLGLQCVIAHKTLHPMWYKPGVAPKQNKNIASSDSDEEDDTGAATRSPISRERRASADDAEAEREEAEFERALGTQDEVGVLGVVVGSAIEYYQGCTTNPLIDYGLAFSHVTIKCRDQWRIRSTQQVSGTGVVYHLRGWYVPVPRARTIVLLVHGAGRDRRTFMRHVPLFNEAGYACLLIDCREHGCSTNTGVGVGYTSREALDVIHAARYARYTLGFERVVACGTSQGAASSIVATVLAEEIEPVVPEKQVRATKATQRNNTERDSEDEQEEDASSPHSQRRNNARSANTESASLLRSSSSTPTAASSSLPPPPLISCVIAENPFITRESCVGDLVGRVLGRIPPWLFPLRWLKRTFVIGAVMAMRYRLGLFKLTRPDQYWMNIRRASSSTEFSRLGSSARHHGKYGGAIANASSGAPSSSPSASFRSLPSLFSRASPSLHNLSLSDFNALELVDRISPRPLLLMHGLSDEVVKPIHSQLLYARARDPKKCWFVADARHTALINTDPQGWQQTAIQFLAEHGL